MASSSSKRTRSEEEAADIVDSVRNLINFQTSTEKKLESVSETLRGFEFKLAQLEETRLAPAAPVLPEARCAAQGEVDDTKRRIIVLESNGRGELLEMRKLQDEIRTLKERLLVVEASTAALKALKDKP
jgi:chromosome segregation ATPase